jgi:hypothetical protein
MKNEIWLGLTTDELVKVFNDSVDNLSPARQREIKGTLKAGEMVQAFGEGMSDDLKAMVPFVINAIRLNNKRLQEQLDKLKD